jgi:hypothetical protein
MRSVQFLDNLNDAVRENPVATGLIGIGVAWMLLGQSRTVVRETRGAVRAAKNTIHTVADTASEAIEPVAGFVDQVRKSTTEMSDAVSDGMKAAAAKVNDSVTGGAGAGGNRSETDGGRGLPFSGRELVDLLERRPLALAALGVVVGAAIATAFPKTAAEDRALGEAGESLRETARNAANTVGDRMTAAIDAATDEAVAQDLTPEAAKEAAIAGAAKLKNVAKAGLSSVEDKRKARPDPVRSAYQPPID